MMRRRLLCGVVACLVAGVPAARAETVEERIVGQLSREGYRQIAVSRTFLGRIRITASGSRGRREIILNPSTGAILRDYLDDDDRDDKVRTRDDRRKDDTPEADDPEDDDDDDDDDKEDKDDDKDDDDKDDDDD
ncbi:hypothetical protein [Maliponia aquimaris]|uniref:PepSY domain-containing protein n=1 Tax=Maliponia aquimaris TaxID=1673631 RepID=A0A238KTH5_9RHOB|nr:hypothetical protein [Maliponia aquimaris]SMX46113.1 hypothetical protein MAA8898_03331 [Maliponia aquimaris]